MTDKEILEYSKQLAKYKSEIGTLDSAAPDLDEQVKEKFNADSVNRAKFIDATVVIGAATKEFRNVFGVDAPHYDLSDECYLAVDRNGNGRFFTSFDDDNKPEFEPGELLEVEDPANNNKKVTNYIDCWAVANAARFDSTMTCSNFFGDNNKALFVDKQNFFTDKKKDSTSSSVHNPVCPPGYDRWAGKKVYDKVCRCFELDELNLYRLFGGPSVQTISSPFYFKASGDDKFDCNINEEGIITKNVFQYKYYKTEKDDNGNIIVTDEEDDGPLIEASHQGKPLLPFEGCKPIDIAPIKWYKYRVADKATNLGNGTYSHQLNLTGSPFENSNLSLVQFELRSFPKDEKFNEGYAILTRNPNQAEPNEESAGPGYYDIEYCINILWREKTDEGNLDLGDTYSYEKPKKFLWWTTGTKTVTVKNNYLVFFSPVNTSGSSLPKIVMEKVARFIYNMENDCLKYYTWINEKKLKNTIPNYHESVEKISSLLAAAKKCIKRQSISNWNSLLLALKNRVIFDIIERDPVAGEADKILNFNKSISNTVTAQYIGEKSYINAWESNIIPNWPKWLRRLLKVASTPKYINITKLEFDIEQIESSFINAYPSSRLVSKEEYKGPAKGDLTISHNTLITLKNFFDNVLTLQQKISLYAKGQTNGILHPTKLYIGSETYTIDNSTEYEITLMKKVTKLPTYDNIKRAQTINNFMEENMTMYNDAFVTLADRINKRTGTLREMYSLLESTNINSQMINQKKHNVSNLSKFISTYEITGGFGSNIATIKLAPWEPAVMAYSNLERMGTVYILADNTTTKKKIVKKTSGESESIDVFNKNYVKATITEIIDLVSDTEYDYSVTKDTEVMKDKTYYVLDNETGKYLEASESDKVDDNLVNLYEQSAYPSSGPVFKVALSENIPSSIKGRNPVLVKVYDVQKSEDQDTVEPEILDVIGDWESTCFVGQPVDISDLSFKVFYSDGSSSYDVIPSYNPTIWGNVEGEQTVTFSYTEDGITLTATKSAMVIAILTSLEVSGNWEKIQRIGFAPDLTGLTFTATFNNGTQRVIPNSNIVVSPAIWSDTIGTQTATFSYTYSGVTATTTKDADVVGLYQEVEYLEGTGTQYINTGLLSTAQSTVDIVFGFTSMASGSVENCAVFGGRNNTTSNTFTFFKLASTNPQGFRFDYNGQKTIGTSSQMTWNTASKYRFTYDGTTIKTENITTGQSASESLAHSSTYTTSPIVLFGVNYNGNIENKLSGRIYKYTYSDGTNSIDLVPSLDWNNRPCMYDKVSRQAFYNQGTGEFLYGREIHTATYIESTGTQYIDTGVRLTNNYTIELDYQLTNAQQSRAGLFGALNTSGSNQGRFGSILSPSNMFLEHGYGAGNDYWQQGLPDTNRHLFRQEKNKLYVDGTLLYTFNIATFSLAVSAYLGNFVFTNYTPAEAKYYGSKWYDGDTLVRDYTPAQDENGIGFWFDSISHSCYLNKGAEPFIVSADSRLPAGYQGVQYLESTGAQWVNTTQTINTATDEVELLYQLLSGTQYKWVFGEHDDNAGARFGLGSGDGAAKRNVAYGTNTNKVADSYFFDTQHYFKANTNGAFIDGTKIVNYASFSSSWPLYLFNLNLNASNYCAESRIWRYRHKRNGVIIHDFVPCYRKFDNVIGFYDLATDLFFTNSGTGTFVTGPEI